MNLLHAVILGIVEGVTEFLPVSSTFHLIFTSKLLGLVQNDFLKLFEVFIQGGAICSVFLLYAREVAQDTKLVKKTVASFIPTALVGFVLYKVIKNVFFDATYLMITVFIIVGLIFFFIEYFVRQKKIELKRSIQTLTYKEALLIGFVQALAVVPGVSRAGAVIVSMMFLRFKRDTAAKYSFILALPTIVAASTYDLLKMRSLLTQQNNNLLLLVVGSLAAFISSYLVMRWFIGFLKKNSLVPFGLYRLLLAIILLLIGIK